MPDRRSETKPMASAKRPETIMARIIAGMMFMLSSFIIQTAAYEPTPRKTAWPKLR